MRDGIQPESEETVKEREHRTTMRVAKSRMGKRGEKDGKQGGLTLCPTPEQEIIAGKKVASRGKCKARSSSGKGACINTKYDLKGKAEGA